MINNLPTVLNNFYIKELLSQKDIDGALVGGACLIADSFLGIIKGA